MGRKVHPVGFRLKSIRDWNTRWFAEGKQYEERLHEDFAIRKLIMKEMSSAGISLLEIERFPNQVQVTIHTARPGIVIGRKGASVKELRGKLRDLTDKAVKVEVEEISQPDTDAQLIAENIARRGRRAAAADVRPERGAGLPEHLLRRRAGEPVGRRPRRLSVHHRDHRDAARHAAHPAPAVAGAGGRGRPPAGPAVHALHDRPAGRLPGFGVRGTRHRPGEKALHRHQPLGH